MLRLQHDHEYLARAIEIAHNGLGRVHSQPGRRRGHRARRRGAGRGLPRAARRPARRGRRDRRVRRRRPGRRDDVRVARAVLSRQDARPPCTDAILARRHRARRRRLRRPVGEGQRARAGHPARRGHRGRRRRRRPRPPRAPGQPGVSQARAHRAPVGAVQVGDDARRQGRHRGRRLEVDQRRRRAASAPTAGARRSTRSRSASAPRSPTTRS